MGTRCGAQRVHKRAPMHTLTYVCVQSIEYVRVVVFVGPPLVCELGNNDDDDGDDVTNRQKTSFFVVVVVVALRRLVKWWVHSATTLFAYSHTLTLYPFAHSHTYTHTQPHNITLFVVVGRCCCAYGELLRSILQRAMHTHSYTRADECTIENRRCRLVRCAPQPHNNRPKLQNKPPKKNTNMRARAAQRLSPDEVRDARADDHHVELLAGLRHAAAAAAGFRVSVPVRRNGDGFGGCGWGG